MATKTKKPKERKPRAKQGYLDGLEPPSIPAIDHAADAYVSVRDSRMALTEEEVQKKAILRAAMLKHNLTTYTYEDRVVELDTEPSVKVKKKKPDVDAGTDSE